jgi:glycosyltransferase involved in cell wall biosynthesis
MERPLVSVIVPVYNGESYLGAALESIFAQDYRPFEVIVVDGQSVDNTASIAKSYKQARYILQTDQGISNAYNIGIDASMGEFVSFLSHDDLWTPDKLTVQINYLMDHPEIEYSIAMVKFFLEPGCSIPPGFRKELFENDHVGQIMETLVAPKSLFQKIGKFDPDLTTAEDVDWFARANDSKIPMAVISRVLLYKRIHNKNISLNDPANNQNLLKALKRSIHRKLSLRSKNNLGEQS